MKLTKKEALEKTIEMWMWLAENPFAKKSDYFLINHIMCWDVPTLGCYGCEYAKQQDDRNTCVHCPIWKDATSPGNKGCMAPGSPYNKWIDSTIESKRTKYALEIVVLAKRKLEELEGD